MVKPNNAGVLAPEDGSLACGCRSTYVTEADGIKTPGCVAFSLPVQRRSLATRLRFQRLSVLATASASRGRSGGAVSSPSGVRSQVTFFQGGLRRFMTDYSGSRAEYAAAGGRVIATPGHQRQTRRRLCRPRVQTGRRLMRQTVMPTRTPARIAPMRSESSVRRLVAGSRSTRRAGLRFGLPLTPESGGPSRHRAAQTARAMHRARRRQESQNAQQDVDRCHPPGRDPGRRGPRQSRRRI